jgi:AcrR family transcriptional regulator
MSEVSEGLRGRQKQARQSDILEAAWTLLSERGYAGWTLADLAERSGVSRRTLYLHFSSKEEIAAETVAKNLLRSAERIRSVAGTDPVARLRAVVRWLVDRGAEPHVIPVGPIKAEPGLMVTVRTFPVYQDAYAALTAALAERIADAQNAGAVTKRHPPETLAALVLQLLRGVDGSRWKEAADLADLAVTTVFEGIGGAS